MKCLCQTEERRLLWYWQEPNWQKKKKGKKLHSPFSSSSVVLCVPPLSQSNRKPLARKPCLQNPALTSQSRVYRMDLDLRHISCITGPIYPFGTQHPFTLVLHIFELSYNKKNSTYAPNMMEPSFRQVESILILSLEIWRCQVPTVIISLSELCLEKAIAPHSRTLAWNIPWMEEPGGLPPMGSHRVGHDWSDLAGAAAELC